VPFKEIAEVIGRRLGLPAEPRGREHFGWFADFAGADMSASSERTRARLGAGQPGPAHRHRSTRLLRRVTTRRARGTALSLWRRMRVPRRSCYRILPFNACRSGTQATRRRSARFCQSIHGLNDMARALRQGRKLQDECGPVICIFQANLAAMRSYQFSANDQPKAVTFAL
jgi:hypothetical protein